jgi:Tol biopolymer transport system component
MRWAGLLVALALALSTHASTVRKGTLALIAYAEDNWELFVVSAGDAAPRRLTHTPVDERAPAISPDGKRIAYATSDGMLWIIDSGGGEPSPLELPKGIYGFPAWLPDGSGIVYTSYEYHPPQEDADLYVYRFATHHSELFVLQTGPQDYAAVSPNGDRIAYISSVATTLPGFGSVITQQLWAASLRTGAPALMIGDARVTSPAWSRDGHAVAFSSDRGGTTEIWILRDGATLPEQVTSGPGGKFSPSWSPDGAELVYASTATGTLALEMINIQTMHVRRPSLFGSEAIEIRDVDWR